MKPHLVSPPLVVLMFILLYFVPVTSALALPPPIVRNQQTLKAISPNVHGIHGVVNVTSAGIKTLPDKHITSTPTVIDHAGVGVSPPPTTCAPSTGCSTQESKPPIKSILLKSLKTAFHTAVKAVKEKMPNTFFVKAIHPESSRLGDVRFLRHVVEVTEPAAGHWTFKYQLNTSTDNTTQPSKEHSKEHEHGGNVQPKRDVDNVDKINAIKEMNQMNQMNPNALQHSDGPTLLEAVHYAGRIFEEGWEWM
ncbi:hypothetical protein QBC32DRAFT_319466 [Pseudoneurospora amorphoporcata]|uniref:Uncharacterized protein n=1 Tax=Pseudoneurospora amorphoporcata TaxID=241081 RepID=A0AAN6NLB6_9PEZI|nr:hypothetical protein QBC32DRAFT_319466 [Pseudoneurospora amorphoporcata]